jgi:hypothetical protein
VLRHAHDGLRDVAVHSVRSVFPEIHGTG